jgi:hypothetical protein
MIHADPPSPPGEPRVRARSLVTRLRRGAAVVGFLAVAVLVGGASGAWAGPPPVSLLIQQGPKLVPSDEVGGQSLAGYSVAVSSDGNTALVGGPLDNDSLGAAWVFTRSGGVWSEQGKLTPSDANLRDGAGAYFGYSVALSADGNTALVGGILDDAGDGAVWVFTRSGGVWTQQGSKLVPNDADNSTGGADFGFSVSLSSDGNTALIGAPEDAGQGAAWVFARSSGVWSQQGSKLLPNDADTTGGGSHFGFSVSISGSGSTALIGGESDNGGVGAVWIFTSTGGAWSQSGSKLTADDEDDSEGGAYFGASVALSANGNTALIGGFFDGTDAGAAWVFTRSGTAWSQQGPALTANDETGVGGEFGYSVALSADGNTALIGGLYDNDGVGAAWIFTRAAGAWSQQGPKLTGSDEAGLAEAGVKVALSSDGTTALVGGPSDNNAVDAAWVFTPSVDHFKVVLSQSKVLSDIGATVTVTAQDAASHTMTSFAGPVTLTDSSGTISAGPFTWANGVGTASVTFTTATNPDRVTATAPSGATGTSGTFDLIGPLDHFLVGMSASTIGAGSNATVKITAQDSLNQTVTDYAGTVTLADLSHSLSLVGSISWSGGVGTATVTFAAAYNPDRVSATDTLADVTSSSGTFDLIGPFDHFLVGMSASTITVGATATVKITAQDSLNQTVKNYSGTIALTDLSGSINAGAFTWVNGVTNVPVTFSTPFNPDRVTATALSAPAGSGTSGTFKVAAIPPPKITSFSNLDGGGTLIWCGVEVEIDGSGFTGATSVLFNGEPGYGFTVNSDTQIDASPASHAEAGVITVIGPHGTGTSMPYSWSETSCGGL